MASIFSHLSAFLLTWPALRVLRDLCTIMAYPSTSLSASSSGDDRRRQGATDQPDSPGITVSSELSRGAAPSH